MKIISILILALLSQLSNAVAATQTEEALTLALRWQSSDVKPIMGDDGRVLFAYGMSHHTLCAPH